MNSIFSWISVAFVICFLFFAILIIPNTVAQIQSSNVQRTSYRGNIVGPQPTLAISNAGASSISVSPGTNYTEHLTIKSLVSITQVLPIRFYLSSSSTNSNSSLTSPSGIIVLLSGNGETFQIHQSAIANTSSNPDDVGLFTKNAPLLFLNGTASFEYTISIPSSVHQGIYELQIVVVN